MKSIGMRIGGKLDLSAIERRELAENRFAHGMNFYKLFWIFMCGSFLGVVIETVWCLATKFEFQVRSGLVYGPFNVIYGFGAVFMTIGLYWLRDRSVLVLCVAGAIIGALIEYVSSWLQEVLFGSMSWDYSGMYFNLDGRVNLLYSVFWGLLAVLWVKRLLPLLSIGIMRIPNKAMKPLTWIVFAYMLVNIAVSAVAVTRWIQRDEGKLATNRLYQVVDERFPNDRMETLYPNLKFLE